MSKCKKCGKKGLFLKVNEDGYCPNCAILIDFERKKRAAEDDIAKLQEQINDKKKNLSGLSEVQNKKQESERNIVIMQSKLNVESEELTETQKTKQKPENDISVAQNKFSLEQTNNHAQYNNPNNSYIQELNQYAREQSEKAYQQHQSLYRGLDFENITLKRGNPQSLTSLEKNFLKALANQEVEKLDLPVYWTYEYNVNYKNLIIKLLENGYVIISTVFDDYSFLTVKQLKEVLKLLSLPVSGKKQELIERLSESNETDRAFKELNYNQKRFVLTDLGKKAVASVQKSMTKNLEFEDKCLAFIMQQDFNSAYKEVCLFRMQSNSGIGIDWQRELKYGLSNNKLKLFTYFWNTDISEKLPKQCNDYIPQIKACLIFGNMMGSAIDGIIALLIRIVPSLENNPKLLQSAQKIQFALMDVEQIKSFYDLCT